MFCNIYKNTHPFHKQDYCRFDDIYVMLNKNGIDQNLWMTTLSRGTFPGNIVKYSSYITIVYHTLGPTYMKQIWKKMA